jgi:hypothetical protein
MIDARRTKLAASAILALALSTGSLAAQTPIAKAPVPPSKSVNITFEGKVTTLTAEDLIKMPQVTIHVRNAHNNADESYTGPLLSDVLARAGLSATRETEPLILHSSIVATGSDHYFVLYSVAEIEPIYSTGQVIVAIMKADLPNTEGGVIQLVNTLDAKPARWVHGLTDLNIMSLAPTR